MKIKANVVAIQVNKTKTIKQFRKTWRGVLCNSNRKNEQLRGSWLLNTQTSGSLSDRSHLEQ